MISQLVAALQYIDPDITDKDIADTVWLALQIREATKTVEPRVYMQSAPLHQHSEGIAKLLLKDKSEPLKPVSPKSIVRSSTPLPAKSGLYPSSSRSGGEDQQMNALPFRSPSASALPGSLDIARKLRPFKKLVRQRGKVVVNEEATAKRIAEEDIWVPVLDCASTRWFEVALVVDSGKSMTIWRQTVNELHHLLASHGAFRDVRLWELDTTDERTVRLYTGSRGDAQYKQLRNEGELIDTNHRRLILVVTDCVSPAWHSGVVTDTLAKWSYYNPVTLLQVLPQRLWSRTALSAAVPVSLHASSPGAANTQLHVQSTQYWDDEEFLPTVPIPIVTLEPKVLAAWAKAIARAEDIWIPGFELVIPSRVAEEQIHSNFTVYEEAIAIKLSATDRVRRFYANASTTAREIATLLSVVPVTLPIVRLVQQAIFQDSHQVHIAEVFLSGLLEITSSNSSLLDPDDVQYDFVDDVREVLRNFVTPNDVSRVLTEISTFITSKLAHPLDFSALLANPLGKGGTVIDKENLPFAHLGAKALQRLGGDYAKLGDWLEEESSKGKEEGEKTEKHAETNNLKKKKIHTVVNNFDRTEKITLSKDHYLVSRQGTFDTSGSPHVTAQADLDHLFATLATDATRDKLVLHFHGGLVDFESGMLAAEDITKRFADVPAYEIFFLWQTALFDILSEKTFLDAICPNISQVFCEPFFQQVLLRVTQFVKGKVDGTNGGAIDRWLDLPTKIEVLQELHNPKDGQEPYSDIDSTALPEDMRLQKHEEKMFRDHLMHNDPVLKQHAQDLVAKQTPSALKGMNMDGATYTPTTSSFSVKFIEHFLAEIRDVALEEIVQVANSFIIGRCISVLKNVIDRLAHRRDHGLFPTIVEEILREFFIGKVGKEVWDGIKKEAAATFGSSPACTGTAFLRGLKTYCDNNPNAHITLVGHSAGGIYICEFLQQAHTFLPQNVTFDVILLAPAISYKLFWDTLKISQSRIRAVRIFAMSDDLEQKDALIPGVYPLSLLYLVSGILEDAADTPILGMQRYFTDKPPYTIPEVQTVFAYLNKYQKSHILSLITAGDGLSSNAKSHAAFYSEEVTIKSVQDAIVNGLT